jgi:hypothetical protein
LAAAGTPLILLRRIHGASGFLLCIVELQDHLSLFDGRAELNIDRDTRPLISGKDRHGQPASISTRINGE